MKNCSRGFLTIEAAVIMPALLIMVTLLFGIVVFSTVVSDFHIKQNGMFLIREHPVEKSDSNIPFIRKQKNHIQIKVIGRSETRMTYETDIPNITIATEIALSRGIHALVKEKNKDE